MQFMEICLLLHLIDNNEVFHLCDSLSPYRNGDGTDMKGAIFLRAFLLGGYRTGLLLINCFCSCVV